MGSGVHGWMPQGCLGALLQRGKGRLFTDKLLNEERFSFSFPQSYFESIFFITRPLPEKFRVVKKINLRSSWWPHHQKSALTNIIIHI
jgi:hypothetical protein